MTPAMAAMVPGGCVEVAQSECDAPLPAPAPITGGGTQWGTPAPPPTNYQDGPTEITVIVKEPTELKPYAGGADVLIQIYSRRQFDQITGAPTNVTEAARGKTDVNGKYTWTGKAPTPNVDYIYRVSISIPGGTAKVVEVPARSAEAVASASGMTSRNERVVSVCPSNVDSLVCAVAEAQLDFQAIYKQQLVAWNYESAGPGRAKVAAFAADTAHAHVPLKHPLLMARWDLYSWWVGDMGIPPKDWPDLIKNFDHTWEIFTAIPFPRWPGIERLFQRCAGGIPIAQGKNNERYNVHSPRLYSKTWSDYFPRTDKQISKDMSAAYIFGLQPIMLCMKHLLERKAEEVKRTARTMAIISYCVILVNLPILIGAGAGGFALVATETYDFVQIMRDDSPLGLGVSAAIAAAALASGDPALVVAALEPIIGEILADVDPTTAMAIKAVYPQVVRLAVNAVASIATTSADAGTNTIVSGASSYLDMSGIASAIAVMAVKAIAMLPKMYAAKAMEAFGDSLAGAQKAAQDVIGFVAGEEVSPEFKPFLVWAVEALGLVDLVADAVDDFLDQFQQALDSGTAQGGGVTVVPEQDGGGVAIVPTNPEGVPTDVNGTPLPGGEAPLTPPSGGSTIPGVPPPTMPPMPSTTTTSGIGGVGGVNPVGAALGVGGATVALLLVTGALS
jgi:hypothetical protein